MQTIHKVPWKQMELSNGSFFEDVLSKLQNYFQEGMMFDSREEAMKQDLISIKTARSNNISVLKSQSLSDATDAYILTCLEIIDPYFYLHENSYSASVSFGGHETENLIFAKVFYLDKEGNPFIQRFVKKEVRIKRFEEEWANVLDNLFTPLIEVKK